MPDSGTVAAPWRGAKAYVLVAAVTAAFVVLVELLDEFDWNRGVDRAVLLAALTGLYAWFASFLARRPVLLGGARWWGRAALGVAAAAFVVNAYQGLYTINESRYLHKVRMDQGQNSYLAVKMLRAGGNPYGRRAMLDPYEHENQVRKWTNRKDCVQLGGDWGSRARNASDAGDLSRMIDMFPAVAAKPECEPVRRGFESLGYKYGPVTLAFYVPFVAAAGWAGVWINHFVFFLALVALLAHLAWREGGRDVALVALPLILLLWPSHLRHNVLYLSASDLPGVVLALAFWVLRRAGRDAAAGACLALSIGAKLMPGLLYAPLLLGMRPRAWVACGLGLAAAFVPFALWDAHGLGVNIFAFNVARDPDGTAIGHFLSKSLAAGLFVAVAVALIGAALWGWRRRWPARAAYRFLLAAHAGVFFTGKAFHNNYLIWALPLLGLGLVSELMAARQVVLASPAPWPTETKPAPSSSSAAAAPPS